MNEGMSTVLPCPSYFIVWLSFIFNHFKNTLKHIALPDKQNELPFCFTSLIQPDIKFLLTDALFSTAWVWGFSHFFVGFALTN